MLSKNIQIVVVGFGSIGKRHYQNLRALGYKNISVFDPDPRSFSLPEKVNRVRTIQEKTLQKFDVAFICTPADTHVLYTRRALQAGCDVFIEKPLSVSLSGTDGLVSLAKQKKSVVMVACNFQFNKAFQKLRQILASRKYGRPVLARVSVGYYLPKARPGIDFKKTYAVNAKTGGGVLLDSGSHVFSYLVELFGPIERASALSNTKSVLGIASEETSGILAQHKSGLVSVATLDYVSRTPLHQIEILLEKGSISLNLKNNRLVANNGVREIALFSGRPTDSRMFLEEIKHFLNCVQTRGKPKQGIEQAQEVLKIISSLKSKKRK